MARKQFIRAKYLPSRLPILGTVVYWLLYRELKLTGVWAGVYIALVGLFLVLGWVAAIYQIATSAGADPVFKEEK